MGLNRPGLVTLQPQDSGGGGGASETYVNNSTLSASNGSLINGNLDIWQLGPGPFALADEDFGPDRYQFFPTDKAWEAVQGVFSLGQSDVPGNPSFYLSVSQDAGVGTDGYFDILIEDVRSYAGSYVTLGASIRARDTGTPISTPVSISFVQDFGTGGGASSPVVTPVGVVSSTGPDWGRFFDSATIPSVAGKTIGSDNNDWLRIRFTISTDEEIIVDVAAIQIDIGAVSLPYRQPYPPFERIKCERYLALVANSIQTPLADVSCSIQFPVQMRSSSPSLTVLSNEQSGGTVNIEALDLVSSVGARRFINTTGGGYRVGSIIQVDGT